MSLATRCPACNTTFKVVRDQLRLADGWVRCGRCNEVFLASDTLTQWAPQPKPLSLPNPPGHATADASSVGPPPPSQATPAVATREAEVIERVGQPSGSFEPSVSEPSSSLQTRTDVSDASTGALTGTMSQPTPQSIVQPLLAPLPDPVPEPLPEPIPEPSTSVPHFNWAAPTPARPRPKAWVTALWGLVAGLALLVLAAQATLAWHDELAQKAPVLRPALEVACVLAECRIEPVRRIEALTVESSQLTQLGGTIYQFAVTIRNRTEVELTAPALDLVLTGNDGQVIARKVFRWADFGLRSRSMAGLQELTLQTNLNTGSVAVTGFTIELFYP